MPTYQYTCTDCGEPLEVIQKFTDDSLTVCPACGGKLRKVYSGVGVVFKGSGFYRTDSRSGSESAIPPAETAKPEKAAATAASSDAGSSSPAAAPAATPAAPKSTPAAASTSSSSGSTSSGGGSKAATS